MCSSQLYHHSHFEDEIPREYFPMLATALHLEWCWALRWWQTVARFTYAIFLSLNEPLLWRSCWVFFFWKIIRGLVNAHPSFLNTHSHPLLNTTWLWVLYLSFHPALAIEQLIHHRRVTLLSLTLSKLFDSNFPVMAFEIGLVAQPWAYSLSAAAAAQSLMCVRAIGSVVTCDASVPFHTRQTELIPQVPSSVPPPCSLDAHINPGLGCSAQEAVSALLTPFIHCLPEQ